MKTAHLYIYGIIDYIQDENASEYGYVNLKGVKAQLDNQKGFEQITVHIHSDGGDVDEGFAIHDFIKSQGKPVETINEGKCHSIATVIFLSGDVRKSFPNAEMIIHNPWGSVGGEKKDIQKYADELEAIENKISELYSLKTNLSKVDALALMQIETKLNADEALAKGFVTEISVAMRAVAKYKPKQKKSKNKKMAKDVLTKKEADKKFKSLGNTLNSILNKMSGKKPVALILQDANGVELDFSELEEGAVPKVGDKANIDGSPADGEYVMPDAKTYVFSEGELTEIKEVEEEENSEASEALVQENDELKAENKEMKKEAKKMKKEIKAFSKDFEEFKKQASSSFKYDPKMKKEEEEENGGKESRSLFKEKE